MISDSGNACVTEAAATTSRDEELVVAGVEDHLVGSWFSVSRLGRMRLTVRQGRVVAIDPDTGDTFEITITAARLEGVDSRAEFAEVLS